jgi:hypothetical protein
MRPRNLLKSLELNSDPTEAMSLQLLLGPPSSPMTDRRQELHTLK